MTGGARGWRGLYFAGPMTTAPIVQEARGWQPRLTAWLAALVLVLTLPLTAISGAAEPVTLGDWMRIIHVTPDREIDASQDGLAAVSTPPPAPVLQTSSEPAPKEPVVRTTVPRLWFSRDFRTTRWSRRRSRRR